MKGKQMSEEEMKALVEMNNMLKHENTKLKKVLRSDYS